MLLPNQSPSLRVVPQLNDANPRGDVFGGWLMAQADIAGAIEAIKTIKGSFVTRAVTGFQFYKPIFVGDLVSFYTQTLSIGTTSVTVKVAVYTQTHLALEQDAQYVADATFVFVAVCKPGVKKTI